MKNAMKIAQDVLDRHGAATLSGDVEETLAWFDLPCSLKSLEGHMTVETETEMRTICAMFVEHLKAAWVTHFVRRCLQAEFTDEDTISVAYQTRIVRVGNLLIDEPYAGAIILRRRSGGWKIGRIEISAAGNNLVNLAMRKRLGECGGF